MSTLFPLLSPQLYGDIIIISIRTKCTNTQKRQKNNKAKTTMAASKKTTKCKSGTECKKLVAKCC